MEKYDSLTEMYSTSNFLQPHPLPKGRVKEELSAAFVAGKCELDSVELPVDIQSLLDGVANCPLPQTKS